MTTHPSARAPKRTVFESLEFAFGNVLGSGIPAGGRFWVQKRLELGGAEPLRLAGAPVIVELDAFADQDLPRVAGVGVVVPAKLRLKEPSPLRR
jgi:hypothetical protein